MEDPIKCCEKCGISGSMVESIKNIQNSNSYNFNNLITFSSAFESLNNYNNDNNSKHENTGKGSCENSQSSDLAHIASTNTIATVASESYHKIQELNLSTVIARKLSGRYMQIKKKDDSFSSHDSTNENCITFNASTSFPLNNNEKKPFEKFTICAETINSANCSKFDSNIKKSIDLTRCGICFVNFEKYDSNTTKNSDIKNGYIVFFIVDK